MTVEMEQPFAWPDVPKDLSLWDQKTFQAAQADRTQEESAMRPDARREPAKDIDLIGAQAKALLSGKEKWKPTPEEWEDVGDAMEVETDVTVPQNEK